MNAPRQVGDNDLWNTSRFAATAVLTRMPRARKSFGPADGARADPPTDSTASETLETFKAQGNGLFKRGKYVQAKAVYSQCLELSELSEQSEDTLSNLSIVHLKLSEWAAALDAAQRVLAVDPTHVKCLYRAGAAHIKLQEYKQALTCFTSAAQQVTCFLIAPLG